MKPVVPLPLLFDCTQVFSRCGVPLPVRARHLTHCCVTLHKHAHRPGPSCMQSGTHTETAPVMFTSVWNCCAHSRSCCDTRRARCLAHHQRQQQPCSSKLWTASLPRCCHAGSSPCIFISAAAAVHAPTPRLRCSLLPAPGDLVSRGSSPRRLTLRSQRCHAWHVHRGMQTQLLLMARRPSTGQRGRAPLSHVGQPGLCLWSGVRVGCGGTVSAHPRVYHTTPACVYPHSPGRLTHPPSIMHPCCLQPMRPCTQTLLHSPNDSTVVSRIMFNVTCMALTWPDHSCSAAATATTTPPRIALLLKMLLT